MPATLRATFMRLAIGVVAAALLLRALLFDRADLPMAVGIVIAAIAYEGFYRMASRLSPQRQGASIGKD